MTMDTVQTDDYLYCTEQMTCYRLEQMTIETVQNG